MASDVCETAKGPVMTVVGTVALLVTVTVITGTVFGWAIVGLTAILGD